MNLSDQEIEDFKSLKPEVIIISDEAFDKLTDMIDNPPEVSQNLVNLFKHNARRNNND